MAIPGFYYTGRHFANLHEFELYVNSITIACRLGVTIHHTISPTPAQWRGRTSIEGLARFYRYTRRWDRGPQIFIAPDGIWELTPLTKTGIHAGICNSTHVGMEHCGNYDRELWPEPIRSLSLGAQAIILRRLGQVPSATSIRGHCDCLPNKTCPGTAIHNALPQIRADVARLMADAVVRVEPSRQTAKYVVVASAGLNIRATPSSSGAKLGAYANNAEFVGFTGLIHADDKGRQLPTNDPRGWVQRYDGGYLYNGGGQYLRAA